jgi:CheY-like chemotaxis protein
VLLNLMGNAVKFTDAGTVTLRLRYEDAAGELHVAVEDTGEGMSQAQQEKLFQRFSQVDASSTRRHGGTGLGLAICKGLVEAMGGAIGVKAEPGAGSVFFFSIAAPAVEAPATATAQAEDSLSIEGFQVLVVDDNPVNRELARLVLSSLGAEVTEAEDGESAVAAAMTQPWQVILMDIRMPVFDGVEALRRIRSQPGPNRATPILAFSADADMDQFTSGIGGFDGIVRKPIIPAAMIEAIARAAEAGQARFAPETARAV